MASLAITVEDVGEVRVLSLAGQVDERGSRDLQAAFVACLAEGRRSVLLDLTRLEAIAGPGLRVLVSSAGRLGGEGGGMALCCLRPAVQKVVEMAGMGRSLEVHSDRAAAWRWLEETVRRRRIARLAGRLLREASVIGRIVMRTGADLRRAALAAELLGAAPPESEEQELGASA